MSHAGEIKFKLNPVPQTIMCCICYRIIALISANIVPSLDIEGCELAITLLLYSYKNFK